MRTTSTLLALPLLAGLALAAVGSGRATRSAQADSTIRPLGTAELASHFGGYLDEYCVTDKYTCRGDGSGTNCTSYANTGSYCGRCATDAASEKCDGDNCCIPGISCSSCVVDTAQTCGRKTAGVCKWDADTQTSSCGNQNPENGDCGTAAQCHTS